METIPAIVLIVVGLVAVVLLVVLAKTALVGALVGAGVLFEYASEQGFVGLVVYIASWVFMFPVMLVLSIGVGLYYMWEEHQFEKSFRSPEFQRYLNEVRKKNQNSN